MIERSTAELRFRVENVRAVGYEKPARMPRRLQVAVGPIAILGNNPWRLAEVVETWGLSNFPRWEMMPTYLGTARLELTRCNAAGKPFWMTELQGGHGNSGLARSRYMRPRDIRLWNWIAVATGAKGVIYWAYHTEATGTESSGFGLVARDGSATERVLEAADDNRLIQAHWDVIENYLPKPEIAILFDQDNCAAHLCDDRERRPVHGLVPRLLQGSLAMRFPGRLYRTAEPAGQPLQSDHRTLAPDREERDMRTTATVRRGRGNTAAGDGVRHV